MIYTYKELLNQYHYNYQINKAILENKLYKIKRGIYADTKYINKLELITKKYPKSIFTLDSAFYYYDLTDVIPQKYYIATGRKDRVIKDNSIKQIFTPNEILEIGKTELVVNNVKINIYDKERLLIELLKRKNKIPFDYYKEIINNYRKQAEELDIRKIEEYLSVAKNQESVYDALMREVF